MESEETINWGLWIILLVILAAGVTVLLLGKGGDILNSIRDFFRFGNGGTIGVLGPITNILILRR